MHVSTQLPQAVGAAYSLKMDNKDACVVTYCGDGSTSEVITASSIHGWVGLGWAWLGRVVTDDRENGWTRVISMPV